MLASRGLASWLEDPRFVAPLLRRAMTTGHCSADPHTADTAPSSSWAQDVPPRGGISVLSAVVDGLLLPPGGEKAGGARGGTGELGEVAAAGAEGLAVVSGYGEDILPGLWEERRRPREEGRAGLVFRVPGLAGGGRGGRREMTMMEVSVPVANTVFQNGRTSTVFASRWEGATWDRLEMVRREDAGKAVVSVPAAEDGEEEARVSVPLVSITPLRPVAAALGNILKTLAVDGKAVPASKELEANVPRLLESRRRMGLGEILGPLNVWALVVPARLGEEWRFGALRTLHVQWMLREGCRLHRVLSGGGGWGAKQGLLSLDPEGRFETTDEEDVERFERDFMAGRLGGSGGGSVVGPGDHVVFCVDTATYPSAGAPDISTQHARLSNGFKVQVRPEAVAETPPIQRLGDVAMQRVEDFFGVVSTAMFVAPAAAAGAERDGVVASMKIDTPGAELSVGKKLGLESLKGTLESPAGGQDEPAFETLLQSHELEWAGFVKGRESKG